MIGIGLSAVRYLDLRAIVVAIITTLSAHGGVPREAPALEDAIAHAVAADPSPLFGDERLEAAIMGYWAWRESGLSTRPRPWSWDAHAHVSCGFMQLRCERLPDSVADQARAWLVLAHQGELDCPDSPLAPLSGSCTAARPLAERRLRRIREWLEAYDAAGAVASE